MKCLIILSLSVVGAFSDAINTEAAFALAAQRLLPALVHEEVHDEFGQFVLRYVTAEGIVVMEKGHLVPTSDGEDYVLVTEGEISYIGDDDQVYSYKFTA